MAAKANKRTDLLILAMAEGLSIADAAERAGVSERTAHRRLAEPDVQARLEKLRDEMFSRATRHLSGLSLRAARKLGELIDEPDRTVALRAIKVILETGCRLREMVSIEERIAALEAAAAERKGAK